ncbi:MAG: DCC1-like thiol-disulfide oxidoreductase family protein [Verrucomicrobiota bacterium]
MAEAKQQSPSERPPWPDWIDPQARILFFDGVCVLCAHWSQFFIQRDPEAKILLAALQAPESQDILRHFGFSTEDFDTMIFVENGQAYTKSSAFFHAVPYLVTPWSWLRIGILVPQFLRDFLYDRVARNRYRWFGQRESCAIPTPETRRHYLPFQRPD